MQQPDGSESEQLGRLQLIPSPYQRLDTNRQEIRLLHVEQGRNAEIALACRLETVSLLDNPQPTYEAISYCWAEVGGTATIELNGRQVDVPGSADKVLRQFRLQDSSRVLWIDAVCINQEDLQERSQQVALMGQIYRSSRATLVWLGDADGATERTFHILNRISHDFYDPIYGSIPGFSGGHDGTEPLDKFDSEFEADDIQPTLGFYKRPWFSRVWVIQEVVLAKSASCHCGPYTIPWTVVCRSTRWLAEFIQRARWHSEFNIVRGMHLASLGLALQNRPTLPLSVILRAVKPLSCSDARDKFYGIHSLTMLPSLGREFQEDYGVNIDYTKAIPAIFRDVTRVGILQHCNLETFWAIDDNTNHSLADGADNWPSWVPRWDLDGDSVDLGGQPTSARGIPFGQGPILSGDRKVDRNLALTYAAAKGMQDCLPLRGYELGVVSARISTFNIADDTEDVQIQDLAEFMSECFTFVNTPARLHLAQMLVATLYSISNLDRVFPGTIEKCFRFLLVSASMLTTGQPPALEDRPAFNTYHTLKPWLPEIFTNIGNYCKNKTFFLTDNGLIGASSPRVAVGDRVVAFFGASDVHVLRPNSQRGLQENTSDAVRKEENVRMSGYTLISRCFIDGLTNNPEPLQVERMGARESIFEIW